jgi:WD40 repeat protein
MSDSGSDIIEESAEQKFARLIDEHERDFKQRLRTLTSFTSILADDHAKSIKQLKRACRDYVAKGREHVQPMQDTKFQRQTAAQNEEAAQTSQIRRPTVLSTRASVGQFGGIGQNPPEQYSQDDHSRDDRPTQISKPSPQAPDHGAPNQKTLPRHVEDDEDDDDEAETVGDINHEELLVPDEHDATTADIPQPMGPPASQTPASTPRPNALRPEVERTPKHGRMTPKRWTDEEEQRMIDTIYTLSRETEQEGNKGDMWRRAQAIHLGYGYTRTWEQMCAKWSMQTRDKCKRLGYTWAEDVMKRVPHMPRKRRLLSPDDPASAQEESTSGFKDRRAKKKSKKGIDAEATRSKANRTPNQPLGHQSDFQLRYTFSGASSDIVQVDWSPDGQHFAAATNSIFDEDNNFSNNRPRNLLYGSLSTKTIRELPEHRLERPKGQPQYVYTTVSAVKFGKTGDRMYTGGYDNKLRVWDLEDESQIGCKAEVLYKNKRIEVMDVTGDQTTIIATGTHSGTRSIRVFVGDADLTADCKEIRPLQQMSLAPFTYAPTCLKFGKGISQNRLIAGFGQDDDTLDGTFGPGCMFVWELAEGTSIPMSFDEGNTFVSDCTWSPLGDSFVVGAVTDPMEKKEPWEHSVVKLYSTTEPRPTMTFSCAARDINDVTYDFGLVTASCTDGSTYVWDLRNPRNPMHTLSHGDSVSGFVRGLDRELNDVGVRYVEWTRNPGQLYTGGSDGFLKLWDTRRSRADVLVQNVADIGNEILCGKFSPDHSSLVIGDEDGRLHLFGKSKTPLPKEDFKFMLAERWEEQLESHYSE